MYQQDSFFDLSQWERVGLVCISAMLAILFLFASYRLLRNKPILIRLSGALILFWVFVWVSPQIYYTYYRMIIPDLPLQWVIWPPASPVDALRMMVFSGPQNLSAHSQGILGWVLLVVPFLWRQRNSGPA
jgi:hypothetical protein